MTDPIQHALHSAATHSPLLASLSIFCASDLLFVLVALLALTGLLNLRRLTRALVVRVVLSLAVAAFLTLLLNQVFTDVRPFVIEHYVPLAYASNDNGFPSDHSLIAALLVFWAWWIDRRWLPLFIVGMLAVMAGRLAIGAHHTFDVLGSLVFAAVGFAAASVMHLPARWGERTLLRAQRR